MREAAVAEMIEYLIDRKKYTVVGYSNYDSTEPLYTALLDPLLGCWRTRVYRTRNVGNGGGQRPKPPFLLLAIRK